MWQYNRKAWITITIMEEWLRWFDNLTIGQKVTLFMDNFSAHKPTVQQINISSSLLQNMLIIWLPPNLTSQY
jgi:hypothetical protein